MHGIGAYDSDGNCLDNYIGANRALKLEGAEEGDGCSWMLGRTCGGEVLGEVMTMEDNENVPLSRVDGASWI